MKTKAVSDVGTAFVVLMGTSDLFALLIDKLHNN